MRSTVGSVLLVKSTSTSRKREGGEGGRGEEGSNCRRVLRHLVFAGVQLVPLYSSLSIQIRTNTPPRTPGILHVSFPRRRLVRDDRRS